MPPMHKAARRDSNLADGQLMPTFYSRMSIIVFFEFRVRLTGTPSVECKQEEGCAGDPRCLGASQLWQACGQLMPTFLGRRIRRVLFFFLLSVECVLPALP